VATETERKFLVIRRKWNPPDGGTVYRQGYLSRGANQTVRVRIAGESAWLTVKGALKGLSRQEFEYSIPVEDAKQLLRLCDGLIEKTRYKVAYGGWVWEVDEFAGDNAGLLMAEVEYKDGRLVLLPDWAGLEVSKDQRYYNANLISNPFKSWGSKA
jgi:adenylate cyclase